MGYEYYMENIEGYEYPTEDDIIQIEAAQFNAYHEAIGYSKAISQTPVEVVTLEVAA